MSKRPGIYVGIRDPHNRKVFRSHTLPTESSHGHLYAAVIGPFRTVRAANLMAEYGSGNPHMQTVADAERIARAYYGPGKSTRNSVIMPPRVFYRFGTTPA